jgi:hypothetical protein
MVNKKGQVTQVIVLMVVILIIGTTVVLSNHILNEFYDRMDESGINTPEMEQAQESMLTNFLAADYALVLLTAVMFVVLVITSFLVPTHPIFMVINILGIFLLVFVGMVQTNVYGEIVAGESAVSAGLDQTADQFGKTNFLISNLPFIAALAIFILSIVMFSKGQGGTY